MQLSLQEQRRIEDSWLAKVPIAVTARVIKRHKSTVYREIKRNFRSDDAFPKNTPNTSEWPHINAHCNAVLRNANCSAIRIWGHCIKVTLLSGSHERTGNLCSIAKIIFPKWPEAIRAEWRVHVPQVVPGQSDMGPAKRRDVFGDIIWDGDAVVSQLGN